MEPAVVAAVVDATVIDVAVAESREASQLRIARQLFPDAEVLHTLQLPHGGDHDGVIAVLGNFPSQGPNRAAPSVRYLRRNEHSGSSDQTTYEALGTTALSSVGTLDLDADGRDDVLAVFSVAGGQRPNSMVLFDLPPNTVQQREMPTLDALLDGVHTVADARARLPVARAWTATEMAGVSTTALLGRLAFASQSQIAAIATPSVEFCSEIYHQPTRASRHCSRWRVAQMTSQQFEREVRMPVRDTLETNLTFRCTDTRVARCDGYIPGGVSTHFVFAGTGARRRLQRITTIDRYAYRNRPESTH